MIRRRLRTGSGVTNAALLQGARVTSTAGGLVCSAAIVCVAATAWPARAWADVGEGERPMRAWNLRPQTMAARMALDAALACSPTVAGLATALSAHDVLVSIVVTHVRGWTGTDVLNGRLVFLSATPGVRHLRIEVNSPPDDRVTIGLLAHELQHAAEVAAAPDVRDDESVATLFRKIGFQTQRRRFETRQAIYTGRRAAAEVTGSCLGAHRRMAQSTGSGVSSP
jgi:hypothetical protein